jgi:hypothetical protein
MAIADYQGAIKSCDVYLRNPNAKEENLGTVRRMQDCANFSIYAMKNPKPFEPIHMGPAVNTNFSEYYPTITVDGNTMLFTRRLVDYQGENKREQEDFFVTHQIDQVWSRAYPMPKNVNTPYNEGAPTISPDGKKLIFVACTDESGVDYGANRQGRGSCDLFITEQNGKSWSNPVNLPGKVNSTHWETQPSLSADGKTLYFFFTPDVSVPAEKQLFDDLLMDLDRVDYSDGVMDRLEKWNRKVPTLDLISILDECNGEIGCIESEVRRYK